MLGMNKTAAITAIALFAGGLMVGCEDTPLTAPSDGEVRLGASPSSVHIDTSLPEDEQPVEVTITAQVFDGKGRIMQGANVVFGTSSGTLASGGSPNSVTTDSNGLAIDILTVQAGDEPSIEVSALSGALTQTVTVTKTQGAGNMPPTAKLTVSPSIGASTNQTVVFDGRSSTDPNDDLITCYQFRIDSTVDESDEIVQGPTLSTIQRQYDTEQTLTVTLLVSDAPEEEAAQWCISGGTPAPEGNFSANTDFINGYEIVCSFGPTVTVTTGPQTLQTGGGTVDLEGKASDANSTLTTYTWDCGNNSSSRGDVTDPRIITGTCQFDPNTGLEAVTYTVTLRVENSCGQTGSDSTTVTILGRQ